LSRGQPRHFNKGPLTFRSAPGKVKAKISHPPPCQKIELVANVQQIHDLHRGEVEALQLASYRYSPFVLSRLPGQSHVMPWIKPLAWATGQIDEAMHQKLEFVMEENRVYRALLDRHSPHWRLQETERKVLDGEASFFARVMAKFVLGSG
jgi:hypothetical protein